MWHQKYAAGIQNWDEEILFGKITHHLEPENWKMIVNGKFGNEDSTILAHDLLAIRIKILFLKLTM